MYLQWPWVRNTGITVLYCAVCGKFIKSVIPGELKKEGKRFYDYCDRCESKKQGHYVADRPEELAIR